MRIHVDTIRPWDLVAVGVGTVLTLLAVFLDAPGFLRVPLGLLFVLAVPGYTFLAALYPEAHSTRTTTTPEGEEDEQKRGLEPLERTALSLGLSIAIVPLLGLALNYTPWGIRLVPIAITLSTFTALCIAIAVARRSRLPEDERFRIRMDWDPAWAEQKPIDKALSVALAVSVVIAFGVLVYVLVTPRDAEAFTEFYILGSDGKAACYPTEWTGSTYTSSDDCLEEIGMVTIGVVNHEHAAQEYTLRMVWTAETRLADNTTTVDQLIPITDWTVALDHVNVDLEPGASFQPQYETNITVPEPPGSGTWRLSFQLFMDEPPTPVASREYMESPHRRLHLWIDA